ncbi:MAG: TolC family protein [Bacteroidales bacterium]|nr:TolC family protein [Bacteroidales bacterium]
MKNNWWKYILFIILICNKSNTTAQEYSLEQCINYALSHNYEIKDNNLNLLNEEINLKSQKNNFLPTINAEINNGLASGFQQTFSETSAGEYESVKSYVNNAIVDVSMDLWNAGARRVLVKRQEMIVNSIESQNANRIIYIKSDVIEKFYKLAIAQKSVEISLQNCQMQDSNVIIAQKLYEIGNRSYRDVMDAKTNLGQDSIQLQKDINNKILCNLELKLAMNCNDSIEIIVNDLLDNREIPTFDLFYENAININPEINAKKIEVTSAEFQLEYYKRIQYPTLSLNYELGTQGQKFMNAENIKFSRQWENNSYQTLFLSLKIPIFNQLKYKNDISKAKIDIDQKQNKLEQRLQTLRNELETVYLGVVQSKNIADMSQNNANKCQQQYNFALQDFKLGNIASYELNVYKNKYISSQLQAIEAEYEFLYRLAILNLFKEQ